MANDLNINELNIKVEADTTEATSALDRLVTSIQKLNSATSNCKGLNNLAKGLDRVSQSTQSISTLRIDALTASLKQLSGIGDIDTSVTRTLNALSRLNQTFADMDVSKIGTLSNELMNLASALQPLSEIGNINLSGAFNQLSRLPEIMEQLANLDMGTFVEEIKQLSEGLQALSEVGKINLNGVINQLNRLPETIQSLANCDLSTFCSQIRELGEALSTLPQYTVELGNSLSVLPKAIANANNSMKKYNETAKATNKTHKSLTNSIVSMTRKFRYLNLALSTITGAFTSVFEESSQYAENLNLFNVAMGDCTESAYEYALSIQQAMGIDMSEWMQYQGVFNTLNRGFGVTNENAQIMSQNLTQLAYDYSSLFNVDVSESFSKLESAMSGQIKGLKEYGNNVSVAQVKQTGLKYGLEGAVSSWDQATQATMRYITIIENANKTGVFNDMARTIESPANAVRILNAQFTQLKRAIGNVASAIYTKIIPYLQVCVQLLTEVVNYIAQLFGFSFDSGIDYSGLESAGTDLDDDMDDLASSADSAGSSVDNTTDSVEKLKKALMGFDEINIIPSPDDSSSSDSGSGSGGSGSGSGSGFDLSSVVLPTYDFLDGLVTSAEDAVERLKDTLKDAFQPLLASWDKYGEQVIQSFKDAFNSMKALISDIGASFAEVWKNGTGEETMDSLLRIVINLNEAFATLCDKIRDAWNENGNGTAIVQSLWNAFNNLLGIVEDFTRMLKELAEEVSFSNLMSAVRGLADNFDALTAVIRDDLDWVFQNLLKPALKWLIEDGLPFAINLVSSLIGWLSEDNHLAEIATAIGSVWTALKVFEGYQTIKAWITPITEVFSNLGGTLTNVVSFAISEVSLGWGTLSSAFASSGITGVISTICTSFGSFVTSAGGITAIVVVVAAALVDAYTQFEWFRDSVNEAFKNIGELLQAVYSATIEPIFTFFGALITTLWNDGIKPFWNNFVEFCATVADVFLSVWNSISPVVTNIINIIGDILNPLFGALGTVVGEALSWIFDFVGGLMSILTDIMQSPFVQGILSFFDSVCDVIADALGWLDNFLKSLDFSGAWDAVMSAIGAVGDFLWDFGGDVVMTISAVVGAGWDAVTSLWDSFKNTEVYKTISGLKDAAWSAISSAWDSITNGDALKTIKGAIGSLWDSISAQWDNIMDAPAIKTIKGAIGSLWDSVSGAYTAIASGDVTKTIKGAIGNLWESVKSQWDNIMDAPAVKTIAGAVGSLWSSITEKWEAVADTEVVKTISGKLSDTWDKVCQAWEDLMDTKVMKTLMAVMSGDFSEAWKIWTSVEDEDATKTAKGEIKQSLKDMKEEYGSVTNATVTKEAKGKEDASFTNVFSSYEKFKDKSATATSKGTESSSFTSTFSDFKKMDSKSATVTAKGSNGSNFKDIYNKFTGIKTKSATVTAGAKYSSGAESKFKNVNKIIDANGKTKTVKSGTTYANGAKARFDNVNKVINKDGKEVSMKIKGSLGTAVDNFVKTCKKVFGFAKGGMLVGGSWKPVTRYATGGLPNEGQMFVAREAGPELVGTINGSTAIMNNSQIVSSVAKGVAEAVEGVVGAMHSGGDQNITVQVVMDSKVVGQAVVDYNNEIVNRTGASPLKV